jgi:hypothetical protein
MVRPSNLRKMFQENEEEYRFKNMVEKFGNAQTLYNYQRLRAIYANRKEPNYVNAMRQSRPILYERLQKLVARLPEEIFNNGRNIYLSVSANSSPKELFNAMNKVKRLRVKPTEPLQPVIKDPLNTLKYTQTYMAQELGKSRNRKNYANKALLFMGQTNFARAVVRAKVILAKRVKQRYARLSEENKKFVNISRLNKSSNPEQLLKALERMSKFNMTNNNASWRFT